MLTTSGMLKDVLGLLLRVDSGGVPNRHRKGDRKNLEVPRPPEGRRAKAVTLGNS